MVTGDALLFSTETARCALEMPTAWAAKTSCCGEKVTAVETPLPDTGTIWGLLFALSVALRTALRVPSADGVKFTLMVQFVPGAKLVPQLFV